MTLPAGTVVAGTYRIDAPLGHGAFGSVYRAEHRFLGRVALKFLTCKSDVELLSAAREGASQARLNHPNILRVFDVNTAQVGGDDVLFIATEYLGLGDLDRYLSGAPRLPLAEVRKLAIDVLGALEHAHARNVLHRDLKPANIFLDGERQLRFVLGDFGVSAELTKSTQVSRAAGTVVFQPPECALGPYVRESDIYGVAVVIFRALTGAFPFPVAVAIDDPALARAKKNPPAPSRFLLSATPAIDQVLLRALHPDPFERFRTAQEFRLAIQGALS
jgi:serine/threonine-protein kinase